MKHIFFILLVFVTCSKTVFAQPDISGIYVDNSGRQIEISDNGIVFSPLRYYDASQYYRCYQNDIYAETDYEWVNDKFIRLRNIQPDYPLAEIKYFEWKRKHASNVKVTVILPDIEGREIDVSMSYFVENTKLISREKTYVNKKHKVIFFIPLDQSTINIRVWPKQLYPCLLDGFEYMYNSYIRYDTRVEFEKNRAKDIEIVIPDIDDNFFGRYCVNGDYIRVDVDKLYWRGRVFEKRYRPEDIKPAIK